MFQKLRIQLTLLCSAVIALILAVLTILCLTIFETGIRTQEENSFRANLNTLYQNLQQQTALSHDWLRQMEYHYQVSLRILDNGVPLFFQSHSENTAAKQLLDLAEETAASDLSIDIRKAKAPKSYIFHREFPLKTDGQSLSVSVALIPENAGTLGVVAVHPLSGIHRRIFISRITFLLADLAALALLAVFFWFFIARMLNPLLENRRKQIQFVASASHELRAPLTVILSSADAVKGGSIPADQQFLDTITEEGGRMSRLIGDMLELASADNHSWSLRPGDTELDTLLLQTWEAFEPVACARGIHWKIDLPEEALPRCLCDADRIRQLLSVLIDNAFSYTPSGGLVCLSLNYTSGFHISVSDNGPGIPDDQKAQVFERFYCGDSSHKNKAHFGLGLSIAAEIVKLHKGKLLLTDTPGGGATFTVILF